MTVEQKIIKNKLGLLEFAKHLGNVSQECKVFGYSRDSFYRFKELYDKSKAYAQASFRSLSFPWKSYLFSSKCFCCDLVVLNDFLMSALSGSMARRRCHSMIAPLMLPFRYS